MLIAEGVALEEADRRASGERCGAHRGQETGDRRQGLKIEVVAWQRNVQQAGEYVGAPRTLAGPFRFGFDGSREVVVFKYRDWLNGQVSAGGPVREKLRDLLRQARTREGLRLVCLEPEIGGVIEKALRWMEEQESGVRSQESEARKDSAA